ncbi:MAG: NAD(P)-dependent oxidoreductase [Candidatus Ranarchaeia archaeon]
MTKKIGWIGTGVMGSPMCLHLINAGYSVSIYNRTKTKALSLLDRGAHWCSSPREVAEQSDIIFTIVGFPKDVYEVYLGREGILNGTHKDAILVDMTTSEPSLAQKIAEKAEKKGALSLDAPVSGGDVGARNGTLAIMVGGSEDAYRIVLPLLRHLGKNIAYMGPAGSGQHTKMSNQILIASTMIGVVESLLYAFRAGLDLDAVIDVIGKGAAASWSINNLGRRIIENDFSPGFFIKHFVKDMNIALQEARNMRLSLPGLALVHQFYTAAMALNLQDLGTQGLYKVLARLNGIQA